MRQIRKDLTETRQTRSTTLNCFLSSQVLSQEIRFVNEKRTQSFTFFGMYKLLFLFLFRRFRIFKKNTVILIFLLKTYSKIVRLYNVKKYGCCLGYWCRKWNRQAEIKSQQRLFTLPHLIWEKYDSTMYLPNPPVHMINF